MSIKFEKINKELKNVVKDLNKIHNSEITFLQDEFNKKLRALKEKTTLEIAFVGQYSAGKSTIISALTNNRSIKIGQDITTDKPQAYKWGDVLVVDTPGIYAGRPDHDKVSIEYMNRADLLVYVITTEGFGKETGKNFKKLAFDENRIDKMMLVINKSSQGDREIEEENWILDTLKVIQPKTAKDLFLSVIDANDYLAAFDYDEEDKESLIEYSNFLIFIDNLNEFISQKGILGKLITPLNLTEEYIHKIINILSSKDEDTKNILELLNRKLSRLTESKNKISNLVNDEIDILYSNIKQKGDDIASIITEGKKSIETKSDKIQKEIEKMIDEVEKNIANEISNELLYLEDELKILVNSDISLSILDNKELKIKFNKDIQVQQINSDNFVKGTDIIKSLGNFSNKFATNSEATKLGLEGLKKVSGSDAHKTIYEVGKFFGKNFKPYEALKMADKIGKFGAFIGKIAPILPLLTAGYEEYQERKYVEELNKAKNEVRKAYEDVADEIKNSFKTQFKIFLKENYNYEIDKTKQMLESIRSNDSINKREIEELGRLLRKIEVLLKEVEKY